MAQCGQWDPKITLAIHAKVMDRRDGEPERLKALVESRELVATGGTVIVPDTVEECVESAEPVNSGSKRP
jgi:hypothetical protein